MDSGYGFKKKKKLKIHEKTKSMKKSPKVCSSDVLDSERASESDSPTSCEVWMQMEVTEKEILLSFIWNV